MRHGDLRSPRPEQVAHDAQVADDAEVRGPTTGSDAAGASTTCPGSEWRSHGRYRHEPSFHAGLKAIGMRPRPVGHKLKASGASRSMSQGRAVASVVG